jgi:hypothetical protein
LAHGVNRRTQETEITGVVSQRPDPPTPVSAPFHKACLKGRWVGASIPDDHLAVGSGAWVLWLSYIPCDGCASKQDMPMTVSCLDCNLPIDEDPWWYDPSAHAMNTVRPTGAVSQQPYPPTSVLGPLHKECLVQRMWLSSILPRGLSSPRNYDSSRRSA